MLPRSPLAPVLLASFVGAACPQEVPGVPLDRPLFPMGMAVARDRLLVVSSDFNLAVGEGALLAADLVAVRAATAPDGANDVASGAYVDAVVLPPFGDRPVVTSGGERVYVPTGGVNRVVVLDVAADGTLSCPETPTVEDNRVRARDVLKCGVG